MNDEEKAASEDLDVSMTQENTLLFIPYSLAVLLGIGMFAGGSLFHTWKTVLIIPFLWIAGAYFVKDDLNAVRVFRVKMRLLMSYLDAWRWGGQSASPAPIRSSNEFRGIK